MITVQNAKELLTKNITVNDTINIDLPNALNYYLAENICSPIAIPLFNQSAMDGYAFKFSDIDKKLTIVNEIPAGDTRTIKIKQGEAVRIFTGAKVPDSCDTVVMQELTNIIDNKLIIEDTGLKLGGNVRKQGNQITKGTIALKKGTKITAGAIGFLSALGLTKVKVYQQPQVVIIATGSELIKPGNPLIEGQIYESNTFMLAAALHNINIKPKIVVVKDNQQATERAIKHALQNSNIILLSGGISVGDYDFVKAALTKNNVSEIFYKIKQKPGKPLYFGKTSTNYIFALPGNPAAALSCFYEYVVTAINIMIGSNQPALPKTNLPINTSYTKKIGRANFLKAYTDFKTVTLLDGQSSDALQSFATANCLIFIPQQNETIKKGEIVEVHLLPV